MSNAKNALPSYAPSRETADHSRLVPQPGPWMEPRWAVMPHVGEVHREPSWCEIAWCDREGYLQSLCYGHWHQWRRAGRPDDVATWVATQAKPVEWRIRSNRVSDLVVDFDGLPPLVVLEIRYVAGEKITSGEWTPNRALLETMTGLTGAARAAGVASLLDKTPEAWAQLVQPSIKKTSIRDMTPGYMKTFFTVLHRALVTDPWAEPIWLWKGMFDRVVHENAWANRGANIRWTSITQDWLREPIRIYARQCLITGTRAWGTVVTWAQATALFSEYLAEEGIDDPELVDRGVFLDYLVSVNESRPSKHRIAGVNTVASLLAAIQAEGLITLGAPVFLRYGENIVPKKQQPRPYPADIVERVDRDVLNDPALERSARMMLQLTRWGGLRISELVNCPIDVLRHNGARGYWVHYFMSKTRSWRSFPLPDDLAAAVRDHQDWVRATYGDDAEYLFPSPATSSAEHGRVIPWSSAGFRGHIRRAFDRAGITSSAITGERVTGGEIHRYRHTIGTALLNAGWSQREVQEFLGHESATMTANYAEILDDTLIRKVREFQQAQADGAAPEDVHPGVERMRARFSYELPNGGCTLPASQSCETRDNPCSDCAFYDAGGPALRGVHEDHRRRLKVHIAATIDPRERDLNQRALDDVERILDQAN